jgi:death on curing protein
VRDAGLLESAVAMPGAGFGGQYLHRDVPEMAAAYQFHLAQNHPFFDGNKRVAAIAAAVFLRLNGWELTADPDDFYRVTLAVADGSADKSAAAAFFRANTRRRTG